MPKSYVISSDSPNEIPVDVRDAGVAAWSNHLVGFFLGDKLSFTAVANHVKKAWKLKGEVNIKSDNRNFYFSFSNDDDWNMVLKANPIFIRGKMFIITQWNPSFGSAQTQIKSVPIWVHMHQIPLILWTLEGINWLACHIGKHICLDENTEKMRRFEYAKALMEISPGYELPNNIPIQGLSDAFLDVIVKYDWTPQICTICRPFGHQTLECTSKMKMK